MFFEFFFNVKLTCFHVFCYDFKNESENIVYCLTNMKFITIFYNFKQLYEQNF